MYPLIHILSSLIFILALKLLDSLTITQLIVIFLSAILIDVDHWFVYIAKKKDFSIVRSYKWFIALDKLKKNPHFLCIFHTIEFFAFIALLSLKYQIFQFIFIGMAFHMALDIITGIITGQGRPSSILYAILKRK
jgi:hypothetical protein